MPLELNLWSSTLGFYTRGNLYFPAYWYQGGWHQFHVGDSDELYICDSLTSCLLFLAAIDEVIKTHIELLVDQRVARLPKLY